MPGRNLHFNMGDTEKGIEKLRQWIAQVETVIIGAGAGLSVSAGLTYTGQRFREYFGDFAEKYGFQDMYSGGFGPFGSLEEFWAYWSRYIFINRYMNPPKPVYEKLFELVKEKDYFVLTTNVDHCFQKAGFAKHRLFYTQGDYGLFQCSKPCHQNTYGNEEVVRKMVEAQGYVIDAAGKMRAPEGAMPKMTIPPELVPHCPRCGRPMAMNLRIDQTFVEAEGWHRASERYTKFLRLHQDRKVLFLEAAVGFNTPGIIKFSFWQMVQEWPDAFYACINLKEAYAPGEIGDKSICIKGDIGETLYQL